MIDHTQPAILAGGVFLSQTMGSAFLLPHSGALAHNAHFAVSLSQNAHVAEANL